VLRAALREAKRNNSGIIDYTDIFTSGDIAAGLLRGDPVAVSRGVVGRSIKEYYKYLNSPSRAVKKLFREAERLDQRSLKTSATKSNTASSVTGGSNRLPNQPSANNVITPSVNVITDTLPNE
jgi:hypothetical protein